MAENIDIVNVTVHADKRAISVYPPNINNSLHTLNVDPILSKLNQKMFEIFIPSFVMVLLVMVIGLIGNAITVYVYLKKNATDDIANIYPRPCIL